MDCKQEQNKANHLSKAKRKEALFVKISRGGWPVNTYAEARGSREGRRAARNGPRLLAPLPARSLHTYSRCDCRRAKVIAAAATCMSFVRRRRFLLRRLQEPRREVDGGEMSGLRERRRRQRARDSVARSLSSCNGHRAVRLPPRLPVRVPVVPSVRLDRWKEGGIRTYS